MEAKRRRRRSTATAMAEAEAAEAAKRAAEIKRALRKKRREEERKAQHARNFNQASMPSSPARQLRIIKGKPRIIMTPVPRLGEWASTICRNLDGLI